MVTTGKVATVDGSPLEIAVELVCVHGDSLGAVQIATTVRNQLSAAATEIKAFC